MSPIAIANRLLERGLLPPDRHRLITQTEAGRPVSLYGELRALLYAGIALLSLGLGLMIYDNYDRIGHWIILTGMALLCAGSFAFAWYKRPPLTAAPVESGSVFAEYALLLACLLFLTLEGYAQYEYGIFGTRYGLVTFIPAVLFGALAYRFDHRGVLGLALTALISWIGVTVRPLELYVRGNFFDQRVTLSAIALSLGLIGAALLLARRRVKPHFTYTYLAVAGNLLLVALLAGLFNFPAARGWFIGGLAVACVAFDRYARQTGSFLFMLMSSVYGYIGLTYLVFTYGDPGTYGTLLYFLLTGSGLVMYLLSARRTLLTA